MAKQIRCADTGTDCDFEVRGNDEDELVRVLRQHNREAHDTAVSRSDARNLIQTR